MTTQEKIKLIDEKISETEAKLKRAEELNEHLQSRLDAVYGSFKKMTWRNWKAIRDSLLRADWYGREIYKDQRKNGFL